MSNPDDAWSIVSNALSSATTSIAIYIYQITDDTFMNLLINAYNNGITIKLLVSGNWFLYKKKTKKVVLKIHHLQIEFIRLTIGKPQRKFMIN